MSPPSYIVLSPSTPFTLHLWIEKNKEAKVFKITKKVPNYKENTSEMMFTTKEKFLPFLVSITMILFIEFWNK